LTSLNLHYTYISLFGFKLFEPVTILTNSIITIYCLFVYFRTQQFNHQISRHWGIFFLLMAVSSMLASLTHGIHDQLGEAFLRNSWILMNSVSLIGIYFFYRATFIYSNLNKEHTSQLFNYAAFVWMISLLVATYFLNNFLLIKIHAGIVLFYSLIVHLITFKNSQAGSGHIVAGIIISFLSIFVHSFKLSFGEWFNYKDISHVIVLTSMVFLFKGVKTKISPQLLARSN
jgi:hypothetical protein